MEESRAVTAPPVILSTRQLAKILDLDERTLRRWAREGRGPRRIKFGPIVRYEVGAVFEWIRAHERGGEQ